MRSPMGIKEILDLEELPKLTPEERQQLRDWLEAEEEQCVCYRARKSEAGKGISVVERKFFKNNHLKVGISARGRT